MSATEMLVEREVMRVEIMARIERKRRLEELLPNDLGGYTEGLA